MSVNEKMTAIADEIRELSGTTETMGLDAMASNVSNANTEIENQETLLAEIASALEGKAGGATIPTCTVTLTNMAIEPIKYASASTYANGNYNAYTHVQETDYYSEGTITIPNVVCGTVINAMINCQVGYMKEPDVSINGSAMFDSIYGINDILQDQMFIFVAPMVAGENCTIEFSYPV